jgi:hypothetical protein
VSAKPDGFLYALQLADQIDKPLVDLVLSGCDLCPGELPGVEFIAAGAGPPVTPENRPSRVTGVTAKPAKGQVPDLVDEPAVDGGAVPGVAPRNGFPRSTPVRGGGSGDAGARGPGHPVAQGALFFLSAPSVLALRDGETTTARVTLSSRRPGFARAERGR